MCDMCIVENHCLVSVLFSQHEHALMAQESLVRIASLVVCELEQLLMPFRTTLTLRRALDSSECMKARPLAKKSTTNQRKEDRPNLEKYVHWVISLSVSSFV